MLPSDAPSAPSCADDGPGAAMVQYADPSGSVPGRVPPGAGALAVASEP